MAFDIRPMTLETADDVAAIEAACFTDPWSTQSLRCEAVNPSAYYLTASDSFCIVAYIGLHQVLDEGHITNIAVSPIYRRQGIAKALLCEIIDYARKKDIAFLTLEVRASNRPAIALYESLGFEQVGTRPCYYRHPVEDALLMTRWLNSSAESCG